MDYPNGTFGWIDISAGDQSALADFYVGLFGIGRVDVPIDDNDSYTMLMKGDQPVAGIGPKQDPSLPTFWNSYVLVDDIDATLARVERLGGTVVMPAFEVLTSGRMGVVGDPTGGMVCLWEPKDHAGAGVFNEHGALTWNELATRDPEAAQAFYAGLFDWTWQHMEIPGQEGEAMRYSVCHVAGKGEDTSNGGCLDMTGVFPDEVPTHWDIYFHVDDTDATCERVTDLGGQVIAGPMDAPIGRFAYLADPEGAFFYVMTPDA